MHEKRILVLVWLGNSPELNSIENLWSIIKLQLRGEDYTTKAKLIDVVIRICCRDLQISEECRKLVDSMPKGVLAINKNKGGHMVY